VSEQNWALAQYIDAPSSTPRLGVLRGDTVHALPEGWPTTTLGLIEQSGVWSERLRAVKVDELEVVEGAQLIAPLTYPRKLLCAGANYYDHAAEMGTARPDPAESPFFFLKPPTTTLVGTGAVVTVARLEEAELDWEAELAVVIADRCHDLTVEEAPAHVFGYAVANDLSARGFFPRPNAVFPAFAFDWLKHKAFDGSCPLGPGIVPAWQIGDPQRLGITLTVNGETKQNSSTSDMVVGVYELVSAVSRTLTLEPGDVILTGTPAGVGMPRKTFLHDGDVVVTEIEGLGRLVNTIAGAK
jgi:2-keto-4-pentenoate hydratase/2-oxohepta-3-ene-1,7-dioic acid hydratase in catechol pathway